MEHKHSAELSGGRNYVDNTRSGYTRFSTVTTETRPIIESTLTSKFRIDKTILPSSKDKYRAENSEVSIIYNVRDIFPRLLIAYGTRSRYPNATHSKWTRAWHFSIRNYGTIPLSPTNSEYSKRPRAHVATTNEVFEMQKFLDGSGSRNVSKFESSYRCATFIAMCQRATKSELQNTVIHRGFCPST